MRNSTVWVYELFAKEIGDGKARRYLKQIGYGNADPSTSNGDYWIEGSLAISAQEQIAFLRKLYRNDLPFRVEHQRLVKDLMITEAGRNWILRAKTGWEGSMGWWVGWVEWPTGPVFFALNIDTPNRMGDLFKREAIARAILRSIEALPPNPADHSGAALMKPRSPRRAERDSGSATCRDPRSRPVDLASAGRFRHWDGRRNGGSPYRASALRPTTTPPVRP
jgi:beta-lactamase class D OXA-2